LPQNIEERLRVSIQKLEAPEVVFDYSIAWSESYRSLFSGEFHASSNISGILDVAALTGRVLLCGRAGSGKSVILRLLAKKASSENSVAVFIDLSRWRPDDSKLLSSEGTESTWCANFLLKNYSSVEVTALDLDVLSPDTPKTIFVDGLNEVPGGTGNLILRALDELVTRVIGLRVIVADRLIRRPLREDRWRLARVEPLSDASVKRALAGFSREVSRRLTGMSRHLFDWPFFLAKAAEGGNSSASGLEALQLFFNDRVGLTDPEMVAVGRAAFDSYAEASSRSFSTATLGARIGEESFQKLVNAGALVVLGESAHFAHHLHHDFLAARHVASNVECWSYTTFDSLSFHASSFDSIALLFASVSPAQKADLVRKVYDWNPYAIAFALAESEYRKPDDLDHEIEQVVLSMLSEKRWDAVIPTAERAADALSLFPREKTQPYFDLKTLPDLLGFVKQIESETPWFNEWKTLFSAPSDSVPADETVERLGDTDSIVGWTLANVLKRVKLTEPQLDCVVALAKSERPVVRWRAVHVLGAYPATGSIAVGFELLDHDTDCWVQYGALRSLVEMAARDTSQLRAQIVQGITERRTTVLTNQRLRDELIRALRIREVFASEGWLDAAMGVVSAYIETSTSIADLDYWGRSLRQLRADAEVAAK
jgi:hypothetical protein